MTFSPGKIQLLGNVILLSVVDLETYSNMFLTQRMLFAFIFSKCCQLWRTFINRSWLKLFIQSHQLNCQHNGIQHNDTLHNDIHHNDTEHNDIHHNDTQYHDYCHKDTQHNDTQHNDTQHNDTKHNDTQHNEV